MDQAQSRDALLYDEDGCDLTMPSNGGGGHPQQTARRTGEEHSRKRSRACGDRGRERDLDGKRPLIGIHRAGHFGHHAIDDAVGSVRRHVVDRDLHSIARVDEGRPRFVHSHHDLPCTARFDPQQRQPG